MSEIRRLRMLLELRRLGTVSAVARSLSFSTSAVSQQLAQLERDVGATLLEPEGRRLRLTPSGEVLLDHAEALLDGWEQARASVSAAEDEVAGSLALGAFESTMLSFVPELVKRLHAEHPGARLSVMQADADLTRELVASRAIDVGLVERYPDQTFPRDPDIVETELFDDHMLLAVPPDLGRQVRGPADLADLDWVLEMPGSPAREWAVSLCRRHGFEPRLRFESTDMLVHHHLVRSGVAVGFVPALLPGRLLEGVELIDLGPSAARTVSALSRRAQQGMPLMVAVLDLLRRL
ncbi:MAG: LysR family transcriptional regulator [Microbacterium sp.]